MDKLTPFDKLTSTPELQIMKLLVPYISHDIRKTIAVYIKFTELQNTMYYFMQTGAFEEQSFSSMKIFEEILPYMPEHMAEQFEQMKGMMDMMDMMQEQDMSDMFQMFSQNDKKEKGVDTDGQLDETSPFSNTGSP